MKKLIAEILLAETAYVIGVFVGYKMGKTRGEADVYLKAAEDLKRSTKELKEKFGIDLDDEDEAQ